jgi:peroxiredoxin
MNIHHRASLWPLLITLFLLLPACSTKFGYANLDQGVKIGKPAPDFTFQDASGKWVSLSDFRGKKVMIFSWSTWCRCKYQLPALEEFYRRRHSDKFEVLAVASDSQGFKWITPYIERAQASFIVLDDPNHELMRKYHFPATENAFLVDEAGNIIMSTIGFDIRKPEQLAELERLIDTPGAGDVSRDPRVSNAKSDSCASGFSRDLCLAEDFRRQGDFAKAEETLRAFLKSHPASAEAHWRLGVVLYQQSRPDDAVAEWQTAYRLEPANYIYMRNVQAYYEPDRFYSELKN